MTDADDPRLADYRSLTDSALRRSDNSAESSYIAESLSVIERSIAAGHVIKSMLVSESKVPRSRALGIDADVFVASPAVLEQITGFNVHRGVLADVHRPAPLHVADILIGAKTIIVLDGVTDTTNVGAIFRNAAALGADAVVLVGGSADPLYRRSIRVSMGAVFTIPWATSTWDDLVPILAAHGFEVLALALTPDASDLATSTRSERVALVLGSEGNGISSAGLSAASRHIIIPMARGVDSLNVAAASAVALWALHAP